MTTTPYCYGPHAARLSSVSFEVESYKARQHLSFEDVAVDSVQNPQLIHIHLRRSKTDQFGSGADIFLGRTSSAQ